MSLQIFKFAEVHFKSTPQMWNKEKLGIKKNTIRKFDDPQDKRKEILHAYMEGRVEKLQIILTNTATDEVFRRTATDVSKFFEEEIYIISW